MRHIGGFERCGFSGNNGKQEVGRVRGKEGGALLDGAAARRTKRAGSQSQMAAVQRATVGLDGKKDTEAPRASR